MEAKQSEITLTWCGKHKNWWVTNCPDCMVDDNEADIKRKERKRIGEFLEKEFCYHSTITGTIMPKSMIHTSVVEALKRGELPEGAGWRKTIT